MTVSAWRLVLLWLALLMATPSALAFIQDESKDPLAAKAEEAMWWGDIGTLEALYAQARSSKTENDWNGRTALQSVRAGMTSVLKYDRLDGAYFRELEQLTARWADEKPDSALRQLLHARALYAWAWFVRGDGYWNTVPEQARADFPRLIERAEQVIADRAALLMADSTTHMYLLMIGRSAGWSLEQSRAVIEDGLTRFPEDGLSLMEEWVFTLLPKWQGDLMQVAKAIEANAPRIQPVRGDEAYARLWSFVAFHIEGNLFRQTQADWPRIRTGFESLTGRVKDPYFRSRMGYLACLAEDRETAKKATSGMDEPDFEGWRGGGAGGRQNHEACMAWLRAGK